MELWNLLDRISTVALAALHISNCFHYDAGRLRALIKHSRRIKQL